MVPWDMKRVLHTFLCFAAARLSVEVTRGALANAWIYIARCPAYSGGLSTHRLCSSTAKPLVHFQRTARTNGCAVTLRLKKKGFSFGEKGVLNKTQYSFYISGNRGYISNRGRFVISHRPTPKNSCCFMCLFTSRSLPSQQPNRQ